MQDLNRLHDQDYAAWAQRTAELLRDGRFAELDVEHLIEELSDTGKSQQHELVSRVRVLLAHLECQGQCSYLSADHRGRIK